MSKHVAILQVSGCEYRGSGGYVTRAVANPWLNARALSPARSPHEPHPLPTSGWGYLLQKGDERMEAGHQNLCAHAEDERSLRKLWDDDLKNYIRKRQWCETIGFALLAGAAVLWRIGKPEFAIAAALLASLFLFRAIKFMIDESNINYLMHFWDLNNAIEEFRARKP